MALDVPDELKELIERFKQDGLQPMRKDSYVQRCEIKNHLH
jgi:hypothetical protein